MMPLVLAMAAAGAFIVSALRDLPGIRARVYHRRVWHHYARSCCDLCNRTASRTLMLPRSHKLSRPRLCKYHVRRAALRLGSPYVVKVVEASREYFGTASKTGYYDPTIAARFARFTQRRPAWQKRRS